MKPKYINDIKVALLDDRPEHVPAKVIRAYVELLPSVKHIVKRYVPAGASKQDREDAESEAVTGGLNYILDFCHRNPKHAITRTTKQWKKKIYHRLNNSVFEYAKYVTLPVVVPRPIRLSLNKYKEVETLVRSYEPKVNREFTNDLHDCLLVYGCRPGEECQECPLDYQRCPLDQLSEWDTAMLKQLMTGDTGSVQAYGRNYRKRYGEWIDTLKTIRHYRVVARVDDAVYPDLDKAITFKELRESMNQVDPRLFTIYCMSFYVTDPNELEETLSLPTPRGWLSKEICEIYRLDTTEYKILLHIGDNILNEFRKHEGLQPLQRGIH